MRRVRSSARVGLVLLTALIAACASETIVATTTIVPTTTTAPAPLRAVVPDGPLLAEGSVEGADYLFVSAAVSAEDVVHAYIIGFRDNESRVMVMSWDERGETEEADPGVDQLELDLEHPGDPDQRRPTTRRDLGHARVRGA